MSEPFIDAGIFIDYVWNLRAERDTLLAQVATLQSDANSWQSGYDKGRHDGAKHRQDEVKQLEAENERYRQHGCDTCDGSGHLHRLDGEYYGACTSCGAYELEQAKRERDQLKAENEALRKAANELRRFLTCEDVHHDKPDLHEYGEPCKVLSRIDAVLGQGEKPGD